jgi:hypothetical protein
MGVKSSFNMTTWYICGGLVFRVFLSKTTESPPLLSLAGVMLGGLGAVDMDSFYRCRPHGEMSG